MITKLTIPCFDNPNHLSRLKKLRYLSLLCLGLFLFFFCGPYQYLKHYIEKQSDLQIAEAMLKKIDTTQLDSKACQLETHALFEMLDVLKSRPEAYEALLQLKSGHTELAYGLLINSPDEMATHLGLIEFFNNAQRSIEWYQHAVALNPDNAMAWNQLGLLYRRIARPIKAEESFSKVLAIGESKNDKALMALGYGNLAHISRIRGDITKAGHYFGKALILNMSLNDQYGIASAYANLATVSRLKNDFESAENLYVRALKIEEALNTPIGQANQLGNLGSVYLLKGNLDLAEDKHKQALEIDRKLGRLTGIADDFNSLGSIYLSSGDYETAKNMYLEALKIDLDLDRKGGMADDYGNLGIAYLYLGSFTDAEQAFVRSVWLNSELGNKNSLAIQYGNLGNFYCKAKGDLVQAEAMYRKSLALFDELENKELSNKAQQLLDELHDGTYKKEVYL